MACRTFSPSCGGSGSPRRRPGSPAGGRRAGPCRTVGKHVHGEVGGAAFGVTALAVLQIAVDVGGPEGALLVPNLLPLVFDVLRQCGVVAEVGSSVCVLFSLSLINQQGSLATGHVVNRYSASETMALGSPFSETVSFVWLVNVSLAAVQLPSSTMSSNASAIFCANCWCLDSRRCHNRPRPCPQSRPYTGARWPLEDRKAPPYRRLWHPPTLLARP